MTIVSARRISFFSIALWWGSLTSIGFVVVPLLFVYLDTPQTAGRMAAHLFDAQAYVSWLCAACLLLISASSAASPALGRVRSVRIATALGLLCSLLVYAVVAPHISARDNLRLWHSLGTAFFALQWLAATWVGVLLSKGHG
jgi:hypothetical protein